MASKIRANPVQNFLKTANSVQIRAKFLIHLATFGEIKIDKENRWKPSHINGFQRYINVYF